MYIVNVKMRYFYIFFKDVFYFICILVRFYIVFRNLVSFFFFSKEKRIVVV